jgi:hypothetical protein
MAGNLLHGDIKKTIHDELGEFITSVDKKFASWEKGNKALSQAQAAFDAELELKPKKLSTVCARLRLKMLVKHS